MVVISKSQRRQLVTEAVALRAGLVQRDKLISAELQFVCFLLMDVTAATITVVHE